ncbi:protein kinase family protein [Streptomyces sp. NPDC003395]
MRHVTYLSVYNAYKRLVQALWGALRRSPSPSTPGPAANARACSAFATTPWSWEGPLDLLVGDLNGRREQLGGVGSHPASASRAADGPRIIDFGVAQVGNASALTATGAAVGTYAFMSPEQVRGERVGAASDLFSLGCVLVFAATGRGPFDAPNIPAIVRRILDDRPRLDGIPPDLRKTIAACLAKSPDKRLSAIEVRRRLETPRTATVFDLAAKRSGSRRLSFREGPPRVPAPAPDRAARSGRDRTSPQRRALIIGGLATAAAIPAAAFWPSWWPGKQWLNGPSSDASEEKPKRPVRRILTGSSPVTSSAAFSPNGTIVAAGGYGNEEESGIQLWDMATGRVSMLTDGFAYFLPDAVTFSPDGRTLAAASGYTGSGKCVGLWDVRTGRRTAALDQGGGNWTGATSVAFSPDGQTLAVCTGPGPSSNGTGAVKLWDVATHRLLRVLETDAVGYGEVTTSMATYSADGRYLAACGFGGALVWDTTTWRATRIRTMEEHAGYTVTVAFSPDGRAVVGADSSDSRGDYKSDHGGIWQWDITTRRTTVLTQDKTLDIAFRRDNRTLASAGEQGVRLWDRTTGRVRPIAGGFRSWVTFSPDGRTLATSDDNQPSQGDPSNRFQLWQVPS